MVWQILKSTFLATISVQFRVFYPEFRENNSDVVGKQKSSSGIVSRVRVGFRYKKQSGFPTRFLSFRYKSNQNSGWSSGIIFSGSGQVSQSRVFPLGFRVFGYPTVWVTELIKHFTVQNTKLLPIFIKKKIHFNSLFIFQHYLWKSTWFGVHFLGSLDL